MILNQWIKEELLKRVEVIQTNRYDLWSESQEMRHQNIILQTQLQQVKNDNQELEKEIKEYDKKIGIIKLEPETTNNNTETTNNNLPSIDKLSDYQIWKNQQNNIVYRKKVFKQIEINDNKNIKFDECCICYEESNSFKIKTNCKHDICMSCILKMNKQECPMCREPFPNKITCLLDKNPEYANVYSSHPQQINNWFNWSGTPKSIGESLYTLITL